MTGSEPAMPCEIGGIDENGTYSGRQTTNCSGIEIGLTKREHFSILILQGIASNSHFGSTCGGDENACIRWPGTAVKLADALIEKLNEKETK